MDSSGWKLARSIPHKGRVLVALEHADRPGERWMSAPDLDRLTGYASIDAHARRLGVGELIDQETGRRVWAEADARFARPTQVFPLALLATSLQRRRDEVTRQLARVASALVLIAQHLPSALAQHLPDHATPTAGDTAEVDDLVLARERIAGHPILVIAGARYARVDRLPTAVPGARERITAQLEEALGDDDLAIVEISPDDLPAGVEPGGYWGRLSRIRALAPPALAQVIDLALTEEPVAEVVPITRPSLRAVETPVEEHARTGGDPAALIIDGLRQLQASGGASRAEVEQIAGQVARLTTYSQRLEMRVAHLEQTFDGLLSGLRSLAPGEREEATG